MGIGEVDRDTGDGGEGGVLGHLSALVPGDGGVDGPGQVGDHGLEGVGDGGRVVAGAQAADEHEPAGAFHQGDQGAAPAGADDQVCLPVPAGGPLVAPGAGADRLVAPWYPAPCPWARASPASGERRCAAGASGAQGLLHPQLGARPAGALDAPGPLGGSAREQGRMPPSSGFSSRRRAAICPGTGPDPPGGSTTRSRPAGSASSPADLGAGQGRPGRGLCRRPAVDPAPRRPRGGSRPTRWAGTGRTWRAMRAAQVPLRQARG